MVLVIRGSNVVYSTIPKFREWLTINYVVNTKGGVLPRFYIFKVKDYKMITSNLQIKNLHGNAKESLDDFFLVKKTLNFFENFYFRWSVSYPLTLVSFG
jgi:hypothetical protein